MTGCINAGLAAEYEKFKRSLAAGFLAWQADLIREYKRDDQFITHNFDFEWRIADNDTWHEGCSYGVQPGINHAEASKCLTLAGTDIYHPTQDESTGAEIAFGGDSIRTLKTAHRLRSIPLQALHGTARQWHLELITYNKLRKFKTEYLK